MQDCNPENHPVVDVRSIAPRDRHPLIFDTFASLPVGASFVLVNDHDPRPLYYQLAAEHPEQFDWEYRGTGPDVWCVRICKTA